MSHRTAGVLTGLLIPMLGLTSCSLIPSLPIPGLPGGNAPQASAPATTAPGSTETTDGPQASAEPTDSGNQPAGTGRGSLVIGGKAVVANWVQITCMKLSGVPTFAMVGEKGPEFTNVVVTITMTPDEKVVDKVYAMMTNDKAYHILAHSSDDAANQGTSATMSKSGSVYTFTGKARYQLTMIDNGPDLVDYAVSMDCSPA